MVTRKFIYYTRRKFIEKNMKKRAALLLAAMMTVYVTACGGGKTPDAPSDADLKKDVQEYITEVVDESARFQTSV